MQQNLEPVSRPLSLLSVPVLQTSDILFFCFFRLFLLVGGKLLYNIVVVFAIH